MKLTKRNGVFVLDWRDAMGKRKRRSLGTRDRAEAELRAKDLMTGRDTRSDVWTLRKALQHTYETVWQHQKSWETRGSVIKVINESLGHLPVEEVDFNVLEEYVTKCYGEDKKPATINRRLATIGKALRIAAQKGHLRGVPPIPLQPENNKRTRWLSDEEEQRLLARCDILTGRDMVRVRMLIEFLVDTGARLGEALKLQPEQIDTESCLFADAKAMPGKRKDRRVPLTKRAAKAGIELARLNRLGGMLNKDQLERRLTRVRNACGLEDVTFHTMRHTCASRLIQRGAGMAEVRDWLGHSSVTVTERYAHLADSSLGHLADLLQPVTHAPACSSVGHGASNVSHFPTSTRRKT